METTQPGPDRIDSMSSRDAAENCQNSISSTETLKEQSFSAKDDKPVPNLPHNATSMDPSRRATLCSLDISGDNTSTYQPNIYAPQAQTFTYGAYENSAGKGNKYPYHFVNVEGMEAVSTGIYSDNQSLMFRTGYGYNPQMPYGPYSPATTPLPSSSGDGQLYYPQYFPSTGPYFQQPPSSNVSYIQTTFPPSQADLKMPVDKQDWLNSSDGTGSLTQWPSPAASPQPLVPVGSFGQGIMSLSSGMVSQQQTPLNAFDSSINSYNRGYFHGGIYQHGSNFGQSAHSLVNNGRSFIAIDQGGQRCKGNASISSFNEYLNEQNRGPRATRPKNANKERCLSMGSKNSDSSPGVDRELYNRPDFSIHYKVAKFFIIKSYSEDNVHKSIKYGVWASTANGNKKLDAAYHEAKENGESCPVFLFFSVNASAQFCGIAEMIGPVDFDKSVNYWQQDKWSGKFPVKWHIIKDVPNNMFRHIILESNDNKPVTNSRDTQEVKLEKGVEMLDIFKTYEADVSILDDFGFYEERQKAMQDCKTRRRQQQQQLHQSNVATPLGMMVDGKHNPASRTNEFIGQISRNFAQVVRVGKFDNEGVAPDRSNSVVATSAALSEESQVSGTK